MPHYHFFSSVRSHGSFGLRVDTRCRGTVARSSRCFVWARPLLSRKQTIAHHAGERAPLSSLHVTKKRRVYGCAGLQHITCSPVFMLVNSSTSFPFPTHLPLPRRRLQQHKLPPLIISVMGSASSYRLCMMLRWCSARPEGVNKSNAGSWVVF